MKKIAFPLIALFLVSSILTPSLLPILDENCDIVILTDTNEEEKQGEKEAEKKYDEKDLFLNNFYLSNSLLVQIRTRYHLDYIRLTSDFVDDILLPPPRIV
ncbi:MAG: hypothetical protein AAGC43_11810 [Bacteroidota bacterium]